MECSLINSIIKDINNFYQYNRVNPTIIIGSETAKSIDSNITKGHISIMKAQGYYTQMYGYKVDIGDFKYGYYLTKEDELIDYLEAVNQMVNNNKIS